MKIKKARNSSRACRADYCLLLSRGSGRFNRFVQFVLGCPQMLFGFNAMSGHVVVIRCTRMLQRPHSFLHVAMSPFQIRPVMHSFRQRGSGGKRQTGRENCNHHRLLHRFPSHVWSIFRAPARVRHFPRPAFLVSKIKETDKYAFVHSAEWPFSLPWSSKSRSNPAAHHQIVRPSPYSASIQ